MLKKFAQMQRGFYICIIIVLLSFLVLEAIYIKAILSNSKINIYVQSNCDKAIALLPIGHSSI